MSGMTMIPSPPVRTDVRPRPLERLEADIVALATQLTAATARLLGMIGEFDAAEGWRDWGMRSTAHWLTWKCGIGMTAAREQVRVARALRVAGDRRGVRGRPIELLEGAGGHPVRHRRRRGPHRRGGGVRDRGADGAAAGRDAPRPHR